MNITLRGLKKFEGMDGEVFRAKICFDGEVIGTVSNSGTGGPNSYNGIGSYGLAKKDYDVLVKAANDAGYTGLECEDLYVGDLIAEVAAIKEHKKNVKAGYPFTAWLQRDLEDVTVGFKTKAALENTVRVKYAGSKLVKVFG